MKPILLVLAAGMGSRYGGLKQMDAIGLGGETIIDYSVFDAMRAGFGKLVFVIRHEIEADFKEIVGRRFEDKIETKYVYQEIDMLPSPFQVPVGRKKPWGTGHAILIAEKEVERPFAVINGDDFYGASSFQWMANELKTVQDSDRAAYSMVGFTLRNTLSEFGSVARGVCSSDSQGFLKNVVELTKIEKDGQGAKSIQEDKIQKLSGEEIVSMNLWGFTPSIFRHLHREFLNFLKLQGKEEKSEFFIPAVVNHLIQENLARVKVMPSKEQWFGITYQADKSHVTQNILRFIELGVYPKHLWR